MSNFLRLGISLVISLTFVLGAANCLGQLEGNQINYHAGNYLNLEKRKMARVNLTFVPKTGGQTYSANLVPNIMTISR